MRRTVAASTANLLGIPPYRIHAEAQRLISTYAQDWPLSGLKELVTLLPSGDVVQLVSLP